MAYRPNPKLKAILEGCANLDHLWGSPLSSHNLFSKDFFLPNCVYIRFTHITNMQPKLYRYWVCHAPCLGSGVQSFQQNLQLSNDKVVQAELALRYWREHQNLYVWALIPLFVCRADYRCLELALIQEWQPRWNYTFICQFFHPPKGLLKKSCMNTNAHFGLATLWRRANTNSRLKPSKTSFLPNGSKTVLNYGTPSTNTKARFETTKMLRSNSGGLTLCHTLWRLSNNIQEPYRTWSLQAIDASIKWWKGKPAPRASALRAPWSLSPDLPRSFKKFWRQWHLHALAHQGPCTYRRSRPSSSNTRPCWTNFATTNRLSQHGPQKPKQNAGVKTGPVTRKQRSILIGLLAH